MESANIFNKSTKSGNGRNGRNSRRVDLGSERLRELGKLELKSCRSFPITSENCYDATVKENEISVPQLLVINLIPTISKDYLESIDYANDNRLILLSELYRNENNYNSLIDEMSLDRSEYPKRTEAGDWYRSILLAYGVIDEKFDEMLKVVKDSGERHYFEPALYVAAANGKADILENILSLNKDINVNFQDAFWISPLVSAALKGHWKVVGLLLSHKKIDVNLQDEDGRTVLMVISPHDVKNQLKIVKMILDTGKANLDIQSKRGDTALIEAVEGQSVKMAKELILAGADMYIKNKRGFNALSLALKLSKQPGWDRQKMEEMVEMFLKKHKNVLTGPTGPTGPVATGSTGATGMYGIDGSTGLTGVTKTSL